MNRLKNWITDHFVTDACRWYKLASVQLAALFALVGGYLLNNLDTLFFIVTAIPTGAARWVLAIVAFFATPTAIRLWKEYNVEEADGE